MALNLFGFLKKRQFGADSSRTDDAGRIEAYARYMRSYRGYSIKGPLGTGRPDAWKRVKFNFSRPIVNIGAGWLAAKPLVWDVDGDPDATEMAHAIWDRSGAESTLLANALLAAIYGDVVAIAAESDEGPRIEFVDPSICFPQFDGADYSQLVSLELAYERRTKDGQIVLHREFYAPDGLTIYEADRQIGSMAYDELPVVWIRNQELKGSPYGISDLECIVDLVEEYDHIASKQTRILDYYAGPTLVVKGIQKGDLSKDLKTIIYLPAESPTSKSDVSFLEMKGNAPDVEAQLTRIRNAIAEVSQVPAVAFGQADAGISQISGIGLEILYGPLLEKTRRRRASWGPALERVMWLALKAAGVEVPLSAVNLCWPDARPTDAAMKVAEEAAAVQAGLRSRRTAMAGLGVEDPNGELRAILVEEKMMSLATPAEAPGSGLGARSGNLNPEPRASSPEPDFDAEIEELLARFTALCDAEAEASEETEDSSQ